VASPSSASGAATRRHPSQRNRSLPARQARGTAAGPPRNSVHYFQRPDAQHARLDPAATSLSGWAARFHLNNQKGDWFSNSGLGFIAPGFEVNDLGFRT
jgi:hypothetical protein